MHIKIIILIMFLAFTASVLAEKISISVSVGSDDGYEDVTGAVDITSVRSATIDNVDEWFAFKFNNILIPAGSTIEHANITIYWDSSTRDEPDGPIYGEDIDNSPTLSTGTNNISNRVRTTANVTWSDTDLGAPGTFTSPNLLNITQEIIDRAGWASGNSMTYIFRGSETSTRDVRVTFFESTDPEAQINITYTTPGVAPEGPKAKSSYIKFYGTGTLEVS